jgi:hypothetical protein
MVNDKLSGIMQGVPLSPNWQMLCYILNGNAPILSSSSGVPVTEQHLSNSVNSISCKEGTIMHSWNISST